MNNTKFYPMAYALAAHGTQCTGPSSTSDDVKSIQMVPFLADITAIGTKIQALFSTKKDIYETALHIKQLIEKAKEIPPTHHKELLHMAFIELEQQFNDHPEELEVIKHTIFKLKN